MPNYPIPVPPDSQAAFWAHKDRSSQNAGLVFDRFGPDWIRDSKIKDLGLDAVLAASKKGDSALLEAWNGRWEALARAAQARPFELQTDWRLIAGLGRKGSLEVGFTFHRYGFPILPGSSLKGLARARGLLEIAFQIKDEKLEVLRQKIAGKQPRQAEALGSLSALDISLSREEESDFLDDMGSFAAMEDVIELGKRFRAIFGTTEHGGHVVFFDAIPAARPLPALELDIMNPHYPDYYKEVGIDHPTTYPTDWQSPIPVKFLTVSPEVIFRFAVGWRRAPVDALPVEEAPQEWHWFKGVTASPQPQGEQNALQQLARDWLRKGLLELGVGGKTSAGYGYFTEPLAQTVHTAISSSTLPALPPGFERGVVRSFGEGPNKSFGHITRPDGTELFVHRNELSQGLTELTVGQKVVYKVIKTPKGYQAQDVKLDE